ncbi:MAG: FIST N-terminal domain-containing protein [Bacteroidota bacterium]
MRSETLHAASVSELEAQLKHVYQSDFTPTLAITFGSIACDLNEVCQLFNQFDIQLMGASSAGEFNEEQLFEESIVVMLLDMHPDHFRIFHTEANYATSFVAGKKLAAFGKEHFSNPAFMLTFSMSVSGESIINGITDEIQGFPKVFGGMAGDDMKMVRSFTFTNNQIGESTVTAIVIDNDAIEVNGLAICGWQPIGVENTITKAKDNVIYTINDEPALKVVKKYFGEYFDNNTEEEAVPMGAAQYPLQMKRGDDIVLRATLFANEDGSLNMAGPVNEGDSFRFSIAPGFDIVEDTINGFREYHQQHGEADALILFSCKARHMSLGPLVEDEINGIQEIWQKPIVGFFSYGEVGQHGTDSSYFYNETCSLVLLREKAS